MRKDKFEEISKCCEMILFYSKPFEENIQHNAEEINKFL